MFSFNQLANSIELLMETGAGGDILLQVQTKQAEQTQRSSLR